MSKFRVVLIQPPGYVFSLGLADVVTLVERSLVSLGHDCDSAINEPRADATNIIVCYHLIEDLAPWRKHRYIPYQLEQLSDKEGWFNKTRLEVLRQAAEVWDYSPINVDFLRARGIARVQLAPLGYHPALERITRSSQPTDILFFGSLNDRRRAVLNELSHNANVKVLFAVFGEERDREIGQAKILLNIHYYEAQIMEQTRLSYLLANRTFVVSESSPDDPYGGGIATAPYGELVSTCLRYLGDAEARFRIARAGYQLMRSRPMVEHLRSLVGEAGDG